MANQALRLVKDIFLRFKKKNPFTLAASVSFYAFLSLFPFFVLVIYFATLFLEKSIVLQRFRDYMRVFPPKISDAFIGNLENILESGDIFSFISFIFLIYFASRVFSSLEYALNMIHGTEHVTKQWKVKLKAFFFFLIASFILIILFFSGSIFFVLAAKLEKIPLITSYYILISGNIIVETVFFSLTYKFLSNRELTFKGVLIAGFMTTVLWEILKHIFGVYIANIDRYSIIYGSIGSIVLLQLWLYYSVLIFLLGAEVSAFLSES